MLFLSIVIYAHKANSANIIIKYVLIMVNLSIATNAAKMMPVMALVVLQRRIFSIVTHVQEANTAMNIMNVLMMLIFSIVIHAQETSTAMMNKHNVCVLKDKKRMVKNVIALKVLFGMQTIQSVFLIVFHALEDNTVMRIILDVSHAAKTNIGITFLVFAMKDGIKIRL